MPKPTKTATPPSDPNADPNAGAPPDPDTTAGTTPRVTPAALIDADDLAAARTLADEIVKLLIELRSYTGVNAFGMIARLDQRAEALQQLLAPEAESYDDAGDDADGDEVPS